MVEYVAMGKIENGYKPFMKAGSIYTSVWFTWNRIGKTTHSKVANPGHILFKWENNKIAVARFSFDPTVLVSEISAAQSTKK